MTKPREEYKLIPQHVLAANKADLMGINHFEIGDKVQYVHTVKGIEPLHSGIKGIDYNYYWNRVAALVITRTTGIGFQKVIL